MVSTVLTPEYDFTVPLTRTALPWDYEDSNGAVFWDPAQPSRLTVPEAVDYLELFFNGIDTGASASNNDIEFVLFKNGAEYLRQLTDDNLYASHNISYGVQSVVEGDYFEIYAKSFTDANAVIDAELMAFSAATRDRLGVASMTVASDIAAATDADLGGLTTEIDSENSWDPSIDKFVVPAGVSHVVVSISSRYSTTGSGARWRVLVDGVKVREHLDNETLWGSGGCFGAIPVSEGQEVGIKYTTSRTTLATYFLVSVEWIGTVV